jgi:hypothetical protein
MAAAAHDPKFAAKVGVPVKVATEFNQADAGTGMIRPKKAKKREPLSAAIHSAMHSHGMEPPE